MREQGQCYACERYIGPITPCPFCDADQPVSTALRSLKAMALLLATVGLALLYLAARHREPPLVSIDAITPAMNFALVRVEGEIVGRPMVRTRHAQDQVGIGLKGPGGKLLRAVAYDETARTFAARGLVLRAGQRLSVQGSLSLNAERTPRLYLRNCAAVAILPALLSPAVNHE